MRLFSLLFIFSFFLACLSKKRQSINQAKGTDRTMQKKEIVLPGKIAVTNIQADTCIIYDNSNIAKVKFKIGRFNDTSFSGRHWMHTADYFIAAENIHANEMYIGKANLIKTDIYNRLIEYIYKVNDGEFSGAAHLTNDDKLLLFTVDKAGDRVVNPLNGLMRMNTLFIMDYHNKKIIKKIDSVGISPVFSLRESPWLFDGSGFIYSINYENGIEGNDELKATKSEPGIYIYSFSADKVKMLLPEAYFGICSPTDLQIAYKKAQSVYCFNLKDNSTKLIYKAGSKEKISDMHWTPDGKYIYLVNYIFKFSDILFDSGEKLIEVETGKEIPFKKIGHGYQAYSWK
jgi:hypothetical protein